MTFMFEVYYAAPANTEKEAALTAQVVSFGGRLDFREEPEVGSPSQAVCLTYEFDSSEQAQLAEDKLRHQGEHTEGVCEYG